MLDKRSDQRSLWEADHLGLAGRDSFCGRLAGLWGQLFRDEDFATLYARYLAASLKDTAEIDWDEPTAGEAFLAEIENDADRLLTQARTAQAARAADSPDRDRIVSVHDPEMRYGRKSQSQRVDGHKAAVAVDPAPKRPPQLITVVAVLPGNASDA